MTITTSAGTTHDVMWIDNPIQDADALALRLSDTRRLPDIASEFDGLASIQRSDEQQGSKTFDGYTVLSEIRRMPDGSVLMLLNKESGAA